MVRKPLVFSVEDLKAMPSISRVVFIECTGNGWENWKNADPNLTVQNTHGLVSTNEWTGVPLKFLIELVGKDRDSTWMLAEGGDAAGVDRSIPLTDEILERGVRGLWAERRADRPAHGFPMRLIMPGLRGKPEYQMAASVEVRRSALDDAMGDRALHTVAGEWQSHANSSSGWTSIRSSRRPQE